MRRGARSSSTAASRTSRASVRNKKEKARLPLREREAGLAEMPGGVISTSARSERRLRPFAAEEAPAILPDNRAAHLFACPNASVNASRGL